MIVRAMEEKDLDGKKFSIEEYQSGVNLPPLHPNCRSCIVPVLEDFKINSKSISVTVIVSDLALIIRPLSYLALLIESTLDCEIMLL